MKSYIVISTSSGLKLRLMPEMEEPMSWDLYLTLKKKDKVVRRVLTSEGIKKCQAYEQHLASLETIDIPNEVTFWKVGDLVKEGEFEKRETLSRVGGDLFSSFTAIPIEEQPQEKEEGGVVEPCKVYA